MADVIIYAGPGKFKFGSLVSHSEGAGGRIVAKVTDEDVSAQSALFGTLKHYTRDLRAEIDWTPMDDWSMIPYLLPFQFVTTACAKVVGGPLVAGTTGTFPVGGNPHDSTNATPAVNTPGVLVRPDGTGVTFLRCGLVGHPSISLTVDKPLFGTAKVSALGILDSATKRNAAGFLYTPSETGLSAAGDYNSANIIRGNWIGKWGSHFTDLESEDGWTINTTATYQDHKAQGLTRKMTLSNVDFSISCRPVGKSATDLLAMLDTRKLGDPNTSADPLLLTNDATGSQVQLAAAQITGGGFEAGGAPLGLSEVTFYTCVTFTTGTPNPVLFFSVK